MSPVVITAELDEAADSPKRHISGVTEEPSSIPDPAEQVEVIEQDPPFQNIKEDSEIIVELVEPSGCQQSSKGTAVSILVLLFLATYFIGYIVGRVNDKD